MKLKINNIELKLLFATLIILHQILNCYQIVNNGNILSDGRWKCQYKNGERFCYKTNR